MLNERWATISSADRYPSKQDTLPQNWANVGPASYSLALGLRVVFAGISRLRLHLATKEGGGWGGTVAVEHQVPWASCFKV